MTVSDYWFGCGVEFFGGRFVMEVILMGFIDGFVDGFIVHGIGCHIEPYRVLSLMLLLCFFILFVVVMGVRSLFILRSDSLCSSGLVEWMMRGGGCFVGGLRWLSSHSR